MTLAQLLADNRIRAHTTSCSEVADLLQIVNRDIQDSRIQQLSSDRKFATSYNAALQLATIVLHAAGYRTSGPGHHRTTFSVLPVIMGSELRERTAFFDVCRRKRNTTDYDRAGGISSTEAENLIESASEFRDEVFAWLEENHAELVEGLALDGTAKEKDEKKENTNPQ